MRLREGRSWRKKNISDKKTQVMEEMKKWQGVETSRKADKQANKQGKGGPIRRQVVGVATGTSEQASKQARSRKEEVGGRWQRYNSNNTQPASASPEGNKYPFSGTFTLIMTKSFSELQSLGCVKKRLKV